MISSDNDKSAFSGHHYPADKNRGAVFKRNHPFPCHIRGKRNSTCARLCHVGSCSSRRRDCQRRGCRFVSHPTITCVRNRGPHTSLFTLSVRATSFRLKRVDECRARGYKSVFHGNQLPHAIAERDCGIASRDVEAIQRRSRAVQDESKAVNITCQGKGRREICRINDMRRVTDRSRTVEAKRRVIHIDGGTALRIIDKRIDTPRRRAPQMHPRGRRRLDEIATLPFGLVTTTVSPA